MVGIIPRCWKMYINIYFPRQDLVPLSLSFAGLLRWSVQNRNRYLSHIETYGIRVRASESVTLPQIFHVLYFYVCDSCHKRYAQKIILQKIPSNQTKAYPKKLKFTAVLYRMKKIDTLKFDNTVALCKHIALICFVIAVIVVVMKE